MAAPTIEVEALRVLEEDDPAAAAELERAYRAKMEARYPKPTAIDLGVIRDRLQQRFEKFHGTEGSSTSNVAQYDSNMDSIRTIRQVRYGRDAMPAKLEQRLQYGYRVRSMQTHHEIEMVTALIGRNPLSFAVPAAGERARDVESSESQSQWLNNLPDALERAQDESIINPLDDSNAECSIQAGFFFLTGNWDDIDEEPAEGESDDDYLERVRRERRTHGLPFGFKFIDPLTVYFDDPSGKGSDEVRLIVESKPYRHVYQDVKRRKTEDEFRELAMPEPTAAGTPPSEAGWGGGSEVETVLYHDCYWYVYMVAGRVVECEPHGFPFNPVVVEIGNRTSASTYPEQFHGVTWGRASIERALNDTLTSDFDSHLTYGSRPMPIIRADPTPGVTPISDQPTVTKIEPGLTLPPGYDITDAFKDFRGATSGQFTTTLMSLHRQGGVSEIMGGTSPGADAAGYTVNMLMSAAMAKYEGLLKAKRRFWQKVGDRARLIVRDVIGDTVEFAVPMGRGRKGIRWLALSPEDVDEIPCIVEIDPLSDENRIAIARWLIDGMERALVSERRVMETGYGVADVDAERSEIDRDAARRVLRDWRIQSAMSELTEAEAAPAPVILGPNGQPVTNDQMQDVGGMAAPNMVPSVGAEAMDRQRGAQMPPNPAGQRPAGLQRGQGQGAPA